MNGCYFQNANYEPILGESPQDNATEQIAYVKPVTVEGQTIFAIFAADGRELAVIENRDLAEATVRQNDMEPLSVH